MVEEEESEVVRFQLDGAAAYTARNSRNFLRITSPRRLVSLRGDVEQPVQSPDLIVCDFFL